MNILLCYLLVWQELGARKQQLMDVIAFIAVAFFRRKPRCLKREGAEDESLISKYKEFRGWL